MAAKKTTKPRATPTRGSKKTTKSGASRIKSAITKPGSLRTEIIFLLDNSGSMEDYTDDVPKVYKTIYKAISENADDQEISCTFYTFGTAVRTKFVGGNIKKLADIGDYNPNEGHTALKEAIVTAIQNAKKSKYIDDPNTSYLLIILTDGQENTPPGGTKYENYYVGNLIKEMKDTDRWSVVVSCPKADVASIAKNFSIPEGNIQGWDLSRAGIKEVEAAQAKGFGRFIKDRKTAKSTTSFFEVNIGKLGVRAVKSELDKEDKNRFKKLKVTKATNVNEFVTDKGYKFELGRVFYSLQKRETIQSYKEIVLQRRGTDEFYGGDAVRDLCGLEHGVDGKVEPGNLGDWIVWVQSTSPNRKLLGGMEILYDTNPVVSHGSK